MNKYIFALILTLLGWTQIQAQNTDLRSAPDVPKFQATLEYAVTGDGATVTATSGNQNVVTGSQLALGAKVQLVVTMEQGYKLSQILLKGGNGSTSVVQIPASSTNATGQTTYTIEHTMGNYAKFTFTTSQKAAVSVSAENLENLIQEVAKPSYVQKVTVKHILKNFKVLYKYTDDGKWEEFDRNKFTKFGDYPIQISRDEDDDNLAFSPKEFTLTITQKMFTITYSVEQANMGESLTATLNGSKVENGSQVEHYSALTFTFIPKSGYRLEKILLKEPNIFYTSFQSKLVDGQSVYTFTPSPITDNSSFVFYAVEKADRTDLKNLTINNLEQTAGTLQDVTVSGAPEGVTLKVKYQLDSKWTETLDKNLAAGSYKVLVVCAEDLNYKEWSTETTLVVKEAEQPTEPEKIEIVLNTDDLKATSVEVGKPLSTSVLSGGYAQTKEENPTTVVGTFEWKNPTTVIKQAGEAAYDVVFTPIDLRYAQAETSVKVKAIQYYTVTTGASVNGKVEIEKANAANKYEAGTTLTLVYTPDVHYQVAANQPTTHKVDQNAVITGQFEAIQHKVTIAKTENGSLTVKNGAEEVKSGTTVAEGTQLNITATPATGYKLAALTNGANPIRNNAITVEGDLNIQATFEKLPAEEFVVTVADMANGKLLLLDENGNSVNKGASVKKGTLTVVAVADKGYELDGNITANGTTVSGSYEVTADTKFEASFKKISYSITKTTADVTITVKKDEKEVTAAEIGDVLKISAEVTNTSKRLLSLVVNGKEIANGGTYTVENAVNIVANLVDKTMIQILDLEQVVTYDGNEKQFVVRSIPAGLQGFTVKYDGAEAKPKNAENHEAKKYTVTIHRDADEQYQELNATGTLTIQAALANHKAPTWKDGKWTSDDGDVTDNSTGKADTDFRDVILTPKNTNHKKVTFSVAKVLDDDKKIKPSVNGIETKAATLRAATTSLSVEATGGTVTFWNGTYQVTEVYEGQTIIIKGLPNAGNSSMANWTVGEKESTGEEVSLTVAAGENKVKVTFSQKAEPASPTVSALTNDQYTGSAIIPSITSSLTGWNIVVKAGGLVVEHPTEAGDYLIYASRSEDQVYAPVVEKEIGSYTIQPQALKANAFKITASAIMKGLSLSASTLSGEAPVAGTFAWAAPETIAEGASVEATTSIAYKVTFTPDSKNYSASDLNLTATVPFLTADAAVRKISFEAAEHGTFVVKVNGTEVTSGTQITQGDKVEVTATPATGYSLEAVKINGTAVTGAYTVGESGDVTIVVTFKQNASQGDDPITPDEPETITDPVVAERTATTAVITWEKIDGATGYKLHLYAKKGDATPLKTYEFDAEGNLKAAGISFTLTGLTAGESYYVETVAITPQGEVKRGIELTGTPTGIEAIAEGSQLYTVKGAIVIVPTSPIEVMIISANGRPIFHDEVSGYTQVTANAGIYVVVLKKGNEQVVEKVVVK